MQPYSKDKLIIKKSEKPDTNRFLRKQKSYVPDCLGFVLFETGRYKSLSAWYPMFYKTTPTIEHHVERYNYLNRRKVRAEDIKKLLILQ